MSERIEVDGAKPADSGRVTEDVVELAVRIHDREEAAQKGEPDPWAEEFPEPYRSERMTAMRLALEAALAAQGHGEVAEWQFQGRDGEWRGFTNDRHRFNTERDGTWPIRALYTRPAAPSTPAENAGVPDADIFWNPYNIEEGYSSIESALQDATEAGHEGVLAIQCATRLPDMRVIPIIDQHGTVTGYKDAPSAPESNT